MQHYPMHISAALASMGPPDDEEAEIYLSAFIAGWESYDLPSLLRALQEGEEFDRLFALWALAATHTPEARDALLLLLESTHPLERWASALALAKEYHDKRALPMLGRMLSEMLPPSTDKHQLALLNMEYHASDYYFLWRREIPDLLGDWGDAASVPALRAALQAALRVELALDDLMRLHDERVDGILGSRHDWTDFEDQVVYALGRLGGFGALAGIAGAETPLIRVEGTVHA